MIRFLCGLWAFVCTAAYLDPLPLRAKWQGRDLDIYGAGAHLLWTATGWCVEDDDGTLLLLKWPQGATTT